MKDYKPIIIVAGEPNSVFLELFFKTLKNNRFKSPIILIASEKIVKLQMKFFKQNYKINLINPDNLENINLKKNKINLMNVNYNSSKPFEKISKKSKKYIFNSFEIAFKLIKSGLTSKLINGPISKKNLFKNKYLGVTEYISKFFSINNYAMLIYNQSLSVSPLTTHLPLKLVAKKINKKMIIDKILLLEKFYLEKLKFKPRIAITGLNPHCESIDKFNEDLKIIYPAVKYLKKLGINIIGPLSADTLFLKANRTRFDLIIGTYHDQVLGPIKTLYEYDAINITVGLPFIRVSPDHGPNEAMVGKNSSNTLSLKRSIQFLDN